MFSESPPPAPPMSVLVPAAVPATRMSSWPLPVCTSTVSIAAKVTSAMPVRWNVVADRL
jgi:hypothetical protein